MATGVCNTVPKEVWTNAYPNLRETSNVQLRKPMTLLGLFTGNVGKEFLIGVENIQGQLCQQKLTPAWMTGTESGNPALTAQFCRQLQRLEHLLQAAQLMWDSPRPLCGTLPRETRTNIYLTPDRALMTDQSLYSTKVQLGEPMSFIRTTYLSVSEGHFRGVEMTKRQLYYQSLLKHEQYSSQKLENQSIL